MYNGFDSSASNVAIREEFNTNLTFDQLELLKIHYIESHVNMRFLQWLIHSTKYHIITQTYFKINRIKKSNIIKPLNKQLQDFNHLPLFYILYTRLSINVNDFIYLSVKNHYYNLTLFNENTPCIREY